MRPRRPRGGDRAAGSRDPPSKPSEPILRLESGLATVYNVGDMKAAMSALAVLLGGCIHFEPNPGSTQVPLHARTVMPAGTVRIASPPLSPEEVDSYVESMREDGWWVADHADASRRGIPGDDPLRHKVIVIFERYGDEIPGEDSSEE